MTSVVSLFTHFSEHDVARIDERSSESADQSNQDSASRDYVLRIQDRQKAKKLFKKGYEKRREQRFEEAIEFYNQSLELDPMNFQVNFPIIFSVYFAVLSPMTSWKALKKPSGITP